MTRTQQPALQTQLNSTQHTTNNNQKKYIVHTHNHVFIRYFQLKRPDYRNISPRNIASQFFFYPLSLPLSFYPLFVLSPFVSTVCPCFFFVTAFTSLFLSLSLSNSTNKRRNKGRHANSVQLKNKQRTQVSKQTRLRAPTKHNNDKYQQPCNQTLSNTVQSIIPNICSSLALSSDDILIQFNRRPFFLLRALPVSCKHMLY